MLTHSACFLDFTAGRYLWTLTPMRDGPNTKVCAEGILAASLCAQRIPVGTQAEVFHSILSSRSAPTW